MPKLQCPKCGKTFALAMHLGRHMTATHGQQAKKALAAAKSAKPGSIGAKPAKSAGMGAKYAKPAGVGAAEQLGALIAQLQAERQEHVEALAEIDAAFANLGLTPATPKRRGRPRRS
jgi:hypothetical protein